MKLVMYIYCGCRLRAKKPAAMHIYHLTISDGKGKAYYHFILRRPSWSADVLKAVKHTSPKDYWKMQMVCLRYLLEKIMYAYSEYQPLFNVIRQAIPNIIFHQGLPDREELEALSEGMDHVVLVLDDLMLKSAFNVLL